jgi:hypothetical protein
MGLKSEPLELMKDFSHRLQLFLMICQLGLFCSQSLLGCFVRGVKSSHRLLTLGHTLLNTGKLASGLLELFGDVNVTQDM